MEPSSYSVRHAPSQCALALCLLLFGCATPYQPEAGFKPLRLEGGYFEKRFMRNEWVVGFKGNSKLDSERARDYCLMRASELCLFAGFDYFEILDEMLDYETQRVQRPSVTSGQGNTTRGPLPQESIRIYKMHIKARNSESSDTLNAFFLYNELSDRYEID